MDGEGKGKEGRDSLCYGLGGREVDALKCRPTVVSKSRLLCIQIYRSRNPGSNRLFLGHGAPSRKF